MKRFKIGLIILVLILCVQAGVAVAQTGDNVEFYGSPKITDTIEVDTVWAANRAGFRVVTKGDRQFVAYYDQHRMMTVASRELDSKRWTKTTLSSKLHWDSHNYVVLGFDEKGYVHVAGNMHANPLVYYRSAKPYDISDMLEVNKMTGDNETRVTYPKFFNSADGRLFFSYRIGGSGSGNILVNQFDTESMTWSSYMDSPLFEGLGADSTRSAYHKHLQDSAGDFHYLWMWRWTSKVETCHQLCYVKTSDLRSWENAFGQPVKLPLRPDTPALIIDDVPSKAGLHNSRHQIIIDSNDQPLVAYVKNDAQGFSQLYVAKPAKGEWKIEQISDWNVRWEFIEGGDMMKKEAMFSLEGFSDEGHLVISWKTTNGTGTYAVDPKTLKRTNVPVRMKLRTPAALHKRPTKRRKMYLNLAEDLGPDRPAEKLFFLKWETKTGSHGKHAPDPIPEGPTSKLLLLQIEE